MKAAIFHPAAREAIRSFSGEVRRELGKSIFDLQKGEVLRIPVFRPMPSIAPGAAELRIRDRSGIYRVFYYVNSQRGILIFHAFTKKTGAPQERSGPGKETVKGVAP